MIASKRRLEVLARKGKLKAIQPRKTPGARKQRMEMLANERKAKKANGRNDTGSQNHGSDVQLAPAVEASQTD